MKNNRNAKELIWDTIKYLFVIIYLILCIYPFYYVIIYSISDPTLAQKGVYLWPRGFSMDGFIGLWQRGDVIRAFFISGSRMVIGTFLSVFFTSMLGFLVTRKEMFARKFVYRFIVITMYFSAGLMPWYVTMVTYKLNNTFLLYIVPSLIGAYNMVLIKTFIEQLPESLEESAVLEGAGFFTLFFRIVLPLSTPIIATVAVFNAVGQWNSWTDNFFLVHNENLKTLQLVLQNYLTSAESIREAMKNNPAMMDQVAQTITPMTIRMTAIVVTVVPIMLVYPFAQKYFTKGIMVGAIKG